MVGVAGVAVEAVLGVGVADHLGVDGRAAQRPAQLLDPFDRDALVEVAEETEPRRLQGRRLLDEGRQSEAAGRDDAAAVEADRSTECARVPRRGR